MEDSNQTIFSLKIPNLDDLIAVYLKIDTLAIIAEDYYNKKILKCREIIFRRSEILACPILEMDTMILLITKLENWNYSDIKSDLQQMGLEIVGTENVNVFSLKQALNYTMLGKLAPKWNQVGNILVQGKNFLTCDQPLNAIDVELIVTEEEIRLCVRAMSIKLPRMKIETENNECPTYEKKWQWYTTNEWCYVLPSMKKGLILSITKCIPEYTLPNYKSMRKHWKNTYGYRLPENDENIIYYNIKFWTLSDKQFTYPDLCVRPQKPLMIPHSNPQSIITTFMTDFQLQMDPLFEKHSTFNLSKPLFPCNQFKFAFENLTIYDTASSQTPSSKPYRSFSSYLADVTPPKSTMNEESISPYFTDQNSHNTNFKKLSKGLKLDSKISKYFPIIRRINKNMEKNKRKQGPVKEFPKVTLHSFFSSKKAFHINNCNNILKLDHSKKNDSFTKVETENFDKTVITRKNVDREDAKCHQQWKKLKPSTDISKLISDEKESELRKKMMNFLNKQISEE